MAALATVTLDYLSRRTSGMSLQDTPLPPPDGSAVGGSHVQSMFRQGEVMVLQSVASGSTLCIYEGQVSGKGIRDSHSQFIVHIRRPGVIALQNVANTDCWLSILEGKTLGTGTGGPYSDFYLREIEEKYVALESVFYECQHVGICDDGELQSPEETPPLDRASLFIPFPLSSVTAASEGYKAAESLQQELPPPYPGPPVPQGYGYPQPFGEVGGATALPSAPPQSYHPQLPLYQPSPHHPQWPPGGALPSHVPPSHAPPRQAERHVVPTKPTIPKGYEITDLLNQFNTLTFIPETDHIRRPMAVHTSLLGHATLKMRCPTFAESLCEFRTQFTRDGGMLLQSSQGTVWVNDAKKIFLKKDRRTEGDLGYEFLIRTLGGAVVAIESLKFPGHFLSFDRSGNAMVHRWPLEAQDVQFTIRVNKFNGPYSKTITSPFSVGMPSIVNQLKDKSVIQLYHKPTMMYLCLLEGGKVRETEREEEGTFLIYRDRGMGRVSLTGYYKAIQKLRTMHNGQLTSVGIEDINMDFYVQETPQGTLSFESVSYPGKYVYLKLGKRKNSAYVTEFSIFLVDMNRTEGFGKRRTTPKYALN